MNVWGPGRTIAFSNASVLSQRKQRKIFWLRYTNIFVLFPPVNSSYLFIQNSYFFDTFSPIVDTWMTAKAAESRRKPPQRIPNWSVLKTVEKKSLWKRSVSKVDRRKRWQKKTSYTVTCIRSFGRFSGGHRQKCIKNTRYRVKKT